MVTLSESSKRELVHDLGFKPERVSVVSPGIDPHYAPGGEKSPTPLVVAVGRLVPVKQFDVLVDALLALKADHPGLEAVIVGEGYKREDLEAQIHACPGRGRGSACPAASTRTPRSTSTDGRGSSPSASAREGWGMTITEAAACATPSVVSDVAGHADAVVDGETGILCRGGDALRVALDRVLRDDDLRNRMSEAARAHAARFTWEATARGTLEVLADAAIARRAARRPMKFTVIGHSCLRIETSGPTILVDPWLFGSCYWRSWWHYPTVAEPAPEVFEPDYVYLTHHHFDHFHFPSMRKRRPRTRTCWSRSSACRRSPPRCAARVPRGHGAAARADRAARARGAGRVVPVRARRLGVRRGRR